MSIDSNRSLERRQWAQLDRYRKDMKLIGSGEGYVDEVYFGKGFSSPPVFSYSSVFSEEQVPVMPFYAVPPRGSLTAEVDSFGFGNDSQSGGWMIQDPGFELQGKYKVYPSSGWDEIPSGYDMLLKQWEWDWGDPGISFYEASWPIGQWFQDNVDDIAGDNNEVGYKFDPRGPEWNIYAHRWTQTSETRNKWSVTDTEHHDLGVGEVGQVCATAVIGPNGYTNWLIPLDYAAPLDYYVMTPENSWRSWRSVSEGANSNVNTPWSTGGAWAPSYPPPYIGGFDGFAHVKCSGDTELQVNATFHSPYGSTDDVRGTKVFPDSHWDWGWGEDCCEDDYSYREYGSVDFAQNVTGGDWSRVDIELPYDGWRAWPVDIDCNQARGETYWGHYWTIRIRVKGTPGATVYLDNIFMTRQMRNVEIPMLTIGVAEWIRDDAGAYIGARLWVTRGDPDSGGCT